MLARRPAALALGGLRYRFGRSIQRSGHGVVPAFQKCEPGNFTQNFGEFSVNSVLLYFYKLFVCYGLGCAWA